VILSVKELTVRHRNQQQSRPAVRDVSFNVTAGSFVGIIGESGAGKTSLGLSLIGLHDPARVDVAGTVNYRGKNVLALSEKERCAIRGTGIGMIFQDATGALDPAMRIIDQVAESIRIHKGADRTESRRLALHNLAEVGVTGGMLSAAPYPYQLSGGLCQRAMIASAFSCEPEILIADEPTSSLDVTTQSQIIGLLNARRLTMGMAIILISHDLALVSSLADEIIVLHEGEAVEQGECAQVLAKPQHEYTARLIAAWKYGSRAGGAAVASA